MRGRRADARLVIAFLAGVAGVLASSSVAQADGLIADFIRQLRIDFNAARVRELGLSGSKQFPFSKRRLGALEVGSPPLGVAASDLDGDGDDELIVLTARELLVVDLRPEPEILGRTTLAGIPAPRGPRDPVGTLRVEQREGQIVVVARSSVFDRAAVYRWSPAGFTVESERSGFPLCPGLEAAALLPGRNYFAASQLMDRRGPPELTAPAYFVSADCAVIKDSLGYLRRVQGFAGLDGELTVEIAPLCRDQATCSSSNRHRLSAVGASFGVTDIDQDGTVEVVASGVGEPGAADSVTVYELGPRGPTQIYRDDVPAGIAALVAAKVAPGQRAALIVLSRKWWATEVELWAF